MVPEIIRILHNDTPRNSGDVYIMYILIFDIDLFIVKFEDELCLGGGNLSPCDNFAPENNKNNNNKNNK